eukprot:scaffold116_cov334-Pavlova_lutheri.AAC.33
MKGRGHGPTRGDAKVEGIKKPMTLPKSRHWRQSNCSAESGVQLIGIRKSPSILAERFLADWTK